MARALPEGSRAEPTAAVPGSPAFPLGGTLALPPSVCRTALALPPGLNCAVCPGGPLPRALYRCVRGQEPPRSRPSEALGNAGAVGSGQRPEPLAVEPVQRAVQPNGPLPWSPPTSEQALGARLRRMGDQFHREHQWRAQWQWQWQHRPIWAHFYHFIFQLLGVFYNLPAEGAVGLGPN